MRYGIVTPYTSYLITEPGMFFREDDRMMALDAAVEESMADMSGEAAVGRSRMSQSNQSASNAAAPQSAGAGAGQSGYDKKVYGSKINSLESSVADLDGSVADNGKREKERKSGSADPDTTVNYVRDQTFVRSEAQWIDARYAEKTQDVVRVQTYSELYFDLLDEYPELGDYLSQGENVVFVVNDDIAMETNPDEENSSDSDVARLRTALDRLAAAEGKPARISKAGSRALTASLLIAGGLMAWKLMRS